MTQKKHVTDEPSTFGNPPSDKQFRSWWNLVERRTSVEFPLSNLMTVEKATLIRASQQEMQFGQKEPETSMELSEVEGYLTSLEVYHELQCLVTLPGLKFSMVNSSFQNLTSSSVESNQTVPTQESLLPQHNTRHKDLLAQSSW